MLPKVGEFNLANEVHIVLFHIDRIAYLKNTR